jgi:hypothetical protein
MTAGVPRRAAHAAVRPPRAGLAEKRKQCDRLQTEVIRVPAAAFNQDADKTMKQLSDSGFDAERLGDKISISFEVGPFEVGEKSDGHYSAWFSGENYKVFDLDMMRTVLVLCRSCAGICRRLRPCS